jgi:hypothetical protein
MRGDTILSQIGIIELSKNDVTKYLIDDNVDVEKFVNDGNEILLYSFVDKEFLESFGETKPLQDKVIDKKEEEEEKKEENAEEEDDEEKDVTELQFTQSKEQQSEKKMVSKGGEIFEDIPNADIPDLLKEETKADADKLKNKSANLNWVQRFMKNDNYRLQGVAKDGDSFFSVILYAFKQIGKKTTVELLRNIVAQAANNELLENYSAIYNSFNNDVADNEHKINIIKKNISQTKERYKNTNDLNTNRALLEQINSFKEDAKKFQKYTANAQPMIEHYNFMKDVHTLDQLRVKMMDSSYYADEFAVAKIEEKLNIKVIVLSKDKFDDGDEDGVKVRTSSNEGRHTW